MTVLKKEPILSNAVLGMLLFILAEIMVFASFISAFTIVKSGFTNWPPMGQPRLPLESTALNSLFLLASAVFLFVSHRYFVKEGSSSRVKKHFLTALLMGGLFIVLQGVEWFRLLGFGLTLSSSVYGSFFYMIIGGHALHVLAAIILLGVMYMRLRSNRLQKDSFSAAGALWFFVVALWPVLYVLVYL